MRDYVINFVLVALVAWAAGVLTFLCGASMTGAMCGGVCTGLATALTYTFGRMSVGGAFNGKILLVQVIAGVLAGLFGGWMLTVG